MSVSSYSSRYSSSSYSSSNSSGSSSSSSSSSGSTGEFSCDSNATGKFSDASFSSQSTIVAPPAIVRPFGCPDYNYFWIENKSKTNPKLSYFYNFKSHCVVWDRPVPKDVPLPFYTYTWTSEPKHFSEDEKDVVVSDAEDELRKRKRLQVKRRNRRLLVEEKDNSIEVISVKKTIKSKKMLDTLWKLYRQPGETVQDVKKRMVDLSENQVKVKSEELSQDEFNRNTFPNVEIKQEPMFDNSEYALDIEEVNKTIKTQDGESDSDPENVSYLIKQEYMMNYADSELENDSDNEERTREVAEAIENEETEDESEEDSGEDEVYEDNHCIKLENNYMTDINGLNDLECDDTAYWLADHLNIEIIENNNEHIFLPEDSLGSNLSEENVNWTFERSTEAADNSMLTCSAVDSTYNVPKLKQISKKYLVDGKKKKKKKVKKKVEKVVETRRVPKIIIKTDGPVMRIKRESEDDSNKPIICDMYGTRTINYNHPPKVKIPRWQSCERLSDSGGSSSESESEKLEIKKESKDSDEQPIVNKKQNISPLKMRPENALELRNWFPQKKNNKRRRSRKKSDSSWCESNISDYSDIDDFTVTLVKMKKEKRSLTPEIKKERSPIPEIKRERSPTPVYEEERSILESENDTSLLTEANMKNYIWTNNSVAMPMRKTVKTEKKSPRRHDKVENVKTMQTNESMISIEATVDLSIVKKEKRSSDLEDNWQYPSNAKIRRVKNNYDSDSSSSSSSCACSKSSCSCASSSTSSSSSGDEEDEEKVPEVKQEIKKEVLTEDEDFVYEVMREENVQ